MFKDGERIRGEISSLAFGGIGVMKNHAKVVFVPFSAPGDVLDCTVSEVR